MSVYAPWCLLTSHKIRSRSYIIQLQFGWSQYQEMILEDCMTVHVSMRASICVCMDKMAEEGCHPKGSLVRG